MATFTGVCLRCGGEINIIAEGNQCSSQCNGCGRRRTYIDRPLWLRRLRRVGFLVASLLLWGGSGFLSVAVLRWFLIACCWLWERGGR